MSYLEDFKAGSVPEKLDLSGDWMVQGLLGPFPIRMMNHTKQFAQESEGLFAGNNRFIKSFKTGYYEAYSGFSDLDPDLEVIKIDYNVEKNPWVMRGLVDEVRFVEDNKMLGRGVYKFSGAENMAPKNIFWFNVTRI